MAGKVWSWSSTAWTTSSSPTRASASTPAFASAATVATRFFCAARRARLDVGGPAVEEADPRRRQDEDVGAAAAVRRPSSAAREISATAAGSSTGRVRRAGRGAGRPRRGRTRSGPRGRWRAAITTIVASHQGGAASPMPLPPTPIANRREGGDDRDGDRGDDQRQLPGGHRRSLPPSPDVTQPARGESQSGSRSWGVRPRRVWCRRRKGAERSAAPARRGSRRFPVRSARGSRGRFR